jgi:hypothetical protein
MAPSADKQVAADVASAKTPAASTGAPSEGPQDVAQAPVQLTTARFVVIFLSLMLCVFLFAVSCQRDYGPRCHIYILVFRNVHISSTNSLLVRSFRIL